MARKSTKREEHGGEGKSVSNAAARGKEADASAAASGAKTAQAAPQADADTYTPRDPEEQVRVLVEENEKLRDQLLRARAEFENFRRRRNNELEQLILTATESLITDLLPVIDDLERLIDSAKEADESGPLVDGARMIHLKLLNLLERRGLERIRAEGEPFDPELHEALMQQPSDEAKPGTVIGEHQPGYLLGGKLLRPSRVVVAAESADKAEE